MDETRVTQPPLTEGVGGFRGVGGMPGLAGAAGLEALVQIEPAPAAAPAEAGAPSAAGDFVEFYGLRENPFADSVNPAYFYRTDGHEEACIRMMLAVRHNISMGLVTGPSGSGKTLVSQLLLQQLDPAKYRPALVLVTPGMSRTALLREILGELGLPVPEGPFVRTQELLRLLSDHIIALHGRGQKLVLLIDECHFLSADNLHLLRTISNIEIPERKLTTCLLFAEDGFLRRLAHPTFESLRNRIYLRHPLAPLTAADCAQYVKYRLLVAGRARELFDAAAQAALHRGSGGVCRRVNKLAMLALVEGFLQRQPLLDGRIVDAAAARL